MPKIPAPRIPALLLALALPAALPAQSGWLTSETSPPPSSRTIHLKAADQTLDRVLEVVLGFAYPDRSSRPTSEVPSTEWKRRITVSVNGTVENALEVIGAQANARLWIEGSRLRWKKGYTSPDLRPPTPEELKVLRRSLNLKATRKHLQQVLGIIGKFVGKIPVVPGSESKRLISYSASGSLARLLEGLSAAANLEIWIDGPYLRASHGYRRREPRVGAVSDKLVNIKATRQELHRVAGVLGQFAGKIVCMPSSLAMMRVDLNARDLSVDRTLKLLSRGRPFQAFEDGPFLRFVTGHQSRLPARRFGPEWTGYLGALYGEERPDDDLGGDDLGSDFDWRSDPDFGDF